MANKDLTVWYWFLNGWQVYRKNLKRILATMLVLFIYLWLLVPVRRLDYGWLIANIVNCIIWPALGGGYSFFCLLLVRKEPAKVQDFMAGFSNFWKVWWANFLWYMMAGIGVFLFIITGIIWFVKYSFSVINVLDKKLSPLEAIKYSGCITYGYKGKLLVLFVLTFGITISFGIAMFHLHSRVNPIGSGAVRFVLLGLIPSFLYHFVILPLAFLSYATAYNALTEHYEQVAQTSDGGKSSRNKGNRSK